MKIKDSFSKPVTYATGDLSLERSDHVFPLGEMYCNEGDFWQQLYSNFTAIIVH